MNAITKHFRQVEEGMTLLDDVERPQGKTLGCKNSCW